LNEENKNRCPKCDKGKLKSMTFRVSESTGRNWQKPKVKICNVCSTIFCGDEKITFVYQNW